MSIPLPTTDRQANSPWFPGAQPEGGAGERDILVIAGNRPEYLHPLADALDSHGYSLRLVQEERTALALAIAAPPASILLDMTISNLDSDAIYQQLRANAATEEIPVIFVRPLASTSDRARILPAAGGVDYITEPFQVDELLARIHHQIALQNARREIQHLQAHFEARVCERTQQLTAANARLSQLAFRDELTGLPNRSQFLEYLALALLQAEREESYRFVVFCLDCDRFKTINDSLGHQTGDRLLVAIARRLAGRLPLTSLVARLGGDEFGILLLAADRDAATAVAASILKTFTRPFSIVARPIFTNASIGLAAGDCSYREASDLLQDADTAMHVAKNSGKGRYCWFAPTMRGEALQRLALETDLRQAIARAEFYLVYQPIVALATGKIAGFETLLRWQHPQRGLVEPGEFIALAEETGAIVAIGSWVLQQACRQLRQWRELGFSPSLNVNLSVRQLERPELLVQLDRALADNQLAPTDLGLEITESACLDSACALTTLCQLKTRRLGISLDDFGTGYSSLSYLHALPIDTLKIDRSFVRQLDVRSGQRGLIPAIVSMAQALELRVVAEGIETAEQLAQLRLLGAGFGQGYFFARPLTAAAATEVLTHDPQW